MFRILYPMWENPANRGLQEILYACFFMETAVFNFFLKILYLRVSPH